MGKLLAFAVAAACFGGAANAQAVSEIGDAGELLGTAQIISGGVTSISGTISDLGTTTNIDDIDLYSFTISTPGLFSVNVGSNLSADNDAKLFLFNNFGQLVASDDDSGVGLRPQFNAGSIAGLTAGQYFLAYNLYDATPIFTDGTLSGWDRAPNPFQIGNYTLTIGGAGGVPEPGTWAMMIAGFGLIGGAMRRRMKTAKLVNC